MKVTGLLIQVFTEGSHITEWLSETTCLKSKVTWKLWFVNSIGKLILKYSNEVQNKYKIIVDSKKFQLAY